MTYLTCVLGQYIESYGSGLCFICSV